jgi:hypothetical protein
MLPEPRIIKTDISLERIGAIDVISSDYDNSTVRESSNSNYRCKELNTSQMLLRFNNKRSVIDIHNQIKAKKIGSWDSTEKHHSDSISRSDSRGL